MKMNANLMRPGNVIEHDGRLWTVLKTQIVQPGKGGAFITVEIRDIRTGNKSNGRWRTADTVEKVQVDEIETTFLFKDGENLTFMNSENYEQLVVPGEVVGEPAQFLQEGMPVTVEMIEGQPVSATLPQTVTMMITEADPVVKGQTASSSYKPAVLENGVRVMVPPHVASGTRIVINTMDGTYMERAKD